ncbi:MAG: hypothetical protein J0J06_15865 [Sphingomonas sp.]|uniref:hypothetical protein n=1 Tax=Sphingomonas sp. TaxID=28214 RepID=UPI001ACC9C5C|nr:hypothetical protein [Sphingomonas sp.]MBN8816910.1 hypothetical protein [Sphingomonas sp.]
MEWGEGYTQDQLDDAQARYELIFPDDLTALLRERRLVGQGACDWSTENDNVREMLAWPFDLLSFDIEHGAWWPDWGDEPRHIDDRLAVLRKALDDAPKLIPILGHRFLPESEGRKPGNPVISMHGFDTIYYGIDLEDYFAREGTTGWDSIGTARHVPFWSDIIERWQEVI